MRLKYKVSFQSFFCYCSILLVLINFSCQLVNSGIQVSVHNTTPSPLYNINVKVSEEVFIQFDSIAPNELKFKFLDMDELPRIDGAYIVEFTRPNQQVVSEKGGYYTNGMPLNNNACVEIGEDFVSIFFDNQCGS